MAKAQVPSNSNEEVRKDLDDVGICGRGLRTMLRAHDALSTFEAT